MTYADFQTTESFRTKKAGANFDVAIVNANDPADRVLGAAAGLNFNDQFSTNPVEELGNDGVDEFTDGRHRGTGTVSAFWTPEWADRVPTRQNFIGRKYTIFNRIAQGREGAGTVVDVFTGSKINSVSSDIAPRGNRMINLGFDYARRYSGEEWAALAGG